MATCVSNRVRTGPSVWKLGSLEGAAVGEHPWELSGPALAGSPRLAPTSPAQPSEHTACLPSNFVFHFKLVLQKGRSLRPNENSV